MHSIKGFAGTIALRTELPVCYYDVCMSTGMARKYRPFLRYVADAATITARWKDERDAMYRETILPIGEVPDVRFWTTP